jgi:hypothetical protein
MNVLPFGDDIDFGAGVPRVTCCAFAEGRLCITPTNCELAVAASCVPLDRTNSCAMPGRVETRSRCI